MKFFKLKREYSNEYEEFGDTYIEEGSELKVVFADSKEEAILIVSEETGEDWSESLVESFPIVKGIVEDF